MFSEAFIAILANKLGISSGSELAEVEERISKARAIELFSSDILDGCEPGSFECLACIHDFLFGEIYEFAGKLRTQNISKGGFRFAPVLYLEEAIANIERMPEGSVDEIIEKYVEMNVAHPFREGNGRSMRIWLDGMLKSRFGKVVDWSLIDKDDYLLAMERSPVKDTEIKVLLKDALTDRIDDRDIFMKGIDASYSYEGYDLYKASDL